MLLRIANSIASVCIAGLITSFTIAVITTDKVRLIDGSEISGDNPELAVVLEASRLLDERLGTKAYQGNAWIFFPSSKFNFALFWPPFFFGKIPNAVALPALRVIVVAPSSLGSGIRVSDEGKTISISRVLAHELAHLHTLDSVGVFAMYSARSWVREGYADWAADSSSFGYETARNLICAGKDDNSNSFRYAKARFVVHYLLEEQKLSLKTLMGVETHLEQILPSAVEFGCPGS